MKWSELPQEYRDLAKSFPEEADFECFNENDTEFDKISAMFYWEETPQGELFWDDCDMAKSIDDLPKIP